MSATFDYYDDGVSGAQILPAQEVSSDHRSNSALRRVARGMRLLAVLATGLVFGLSLALAILLVLATQFFGFSILAVQTDSMVPKLHAGDLVVTRPVSLSSIKEQDIILYQDNKDHVQIVHRVVAIHKFVTNFVDTSGKTIGSRTDINLVTKGDANPYADPSETTAQTFKGELWFSIPKLGKTTTMPLQTFLFGIAGLIAVAWLSWELYHRVGPSKQKASDSR